MHPRRLWAKMQNKKSKEIEKALVKLSISRLRDIDILDQISTINELLIDDFIEEILIDEDITSINIKGIKNSLQDLKEIYNDVLMSRKIN